MCYSILTADSNWDIAVARPRQNSSTLPLLFAFATLSNTVARLRSSGITLCQAFHIQCTGYKTSCAPKSTTLFQGFTSFRFTQTHNRSWVSIYIYTYILCPQRSPYSRRSSAHLTNTFHFLQAAVSQKWWMLAYIIAQLSLASDWRDVCRCHLIFQRNSRRRLAQLIHTGHTFKHATCYITWYAACYTHANITGHITNKAKDTLRTSKQSNKWYAALFPTKTPSIAPPWPKGFCCQTPQLMDGYLRGLSPATVWRWSRKRLPS